MKKVIFIFFIFFSASAFSEKNLVGTWRFTEYIYQGQTHPAPNPDLDLRFSFYENGFSLLKWFRANENGYCQRLSSHKVDKNWLTQTTVWVDPANHISCDQDLEMHLGYTSTTSFQIKDQKLLLDLELNGEPFIYVFYKLDFLGLN